MNIKNFVSSLLPSFEKGRILEDLTLLKQELRDYTLPSYVTAAQVFARKSPQAKSAQQFDKQFSAKVKVRGLSGHYLLVTKGVLERVSANFDMVEGLVQKTFSHDVAASGLTYLKANLIQYVEAMSFAVRYARKLLLWTLSEEDLHLRINGKMTGALTKAETDWLWANRETFSYCLNILGVQTKDLETTLKNIPDLVVVPEQVDVVRETIGDAKLDPMKFNLVGTVLNPIYHVRIAIAEWQVKRLKAAEQEALALEYRLLALRNQAEGKEDAKLDQLIEYTEGRLQKLNRQIAEMEGGDNG